MIGRRLLGLAALFVVPVVVGSYLIGDIVHGRSITPAILANYVWILPYAVAAAEWVRLGSQLSLVSRIAIVLTNLIMIGLLLTVSA